MRPTVIDINLDAISNNYLAIKQFVGQSALMPIVKANAYGHGLIECARLFESLGAAYLGVAFLEEALELRKAGIKVPILALGGISGRQVDLFIENNIDITASSPMKLEQIEERAQSLKRRARVHIKIDTGMERIGVHYYSVEKFLPVISKCKNCDVVGIYSHFACSESSDLSFTKEQLKRFNESVEKLSNKPNIIKHIANSGAILQLPESHLDLVRPGLLLYGISPLEVSTCPIKLKRALTLRSEVVYFKVVKKGAGVSYDHTWYADKDTRVVTIPVGYGDGYPRRLSNKGRVLIRGRSYPIIGRVCMDQFMVNIGDGEAYNGDEVVLIGRQGEQEITISEIAKIIETDPREVLLTLNLRVPRRF